MERNRHISGQFAFTSLSGLVSYFYLGASVTSIAEHKSYADARTELRARAKIDIPGELRDMRNLPYFQSKAKEIVLKYPKAFLLSTGLSLFHFFTHDGYFDTFKRTHIIEGAPQSKSQIALLLNGEFESLIKVLKEFLAWPWILFVGTRALWILIFLLYIVGTLYAWFSRAMPRFTITFVQCIIWAFALTSSVVGQGIHGRLRMPIDIFILGFAVYGALFVWKMIKYFKRKTIFHRISFLKKST
jgi:hypothetical protein